MSGRAATPRRAKRAAAELELSGRGGRARTDTGDGHGYGRGYTLAASDVFAFAFASDRYRENSSFFFLSFFLFRVISGTYSSFIRPARRYRLKQISISAAAPSNSKRSSERDADSDATRRDVVALIAVGGRGRGWWRAGRPDRKSRRAAATGRRRRRGVFRNCCDWRAAFDSAGPALPIYNSRRNGVPGAASRPFTRNGRVATRVRLPAVRRLRFAGASPTAPAACPPSRSRGERRLRKILRRVSTFD